MLTGWYDLSEVVSNNESTTDDSTANTNSNESK